MPHVGQIIVRDFLPMLHVKRLKLARISSVGFSNAQLYCIELIYGSIYPSAIKHRSRVLKWSPQLISPFAIFENKIYFKHWHLTLGLTICSVTQRFDLHAPDFAISSSLQTVQGLGPGTQSYKVHVLQDQKTKASAHVMGGRPKSDVYSISPFRETPVHILVGVRG